MIRPLVLVFLAVLFHSTEAALAVAFGIPDLPVVPGVVLLVYAIVVEPPIEATISALALGFVMDALSGTPLGLHMVACLSTLVIARFFAHVVTSPRSTVAFFFAMGCSAAYHSIAILILLLFSGHREAIGIGDVLATASANGLLALLIFPPIRSLFIALGLEEREVSFQARLSQQAEKRRGRLLP